MGPSRQKEQNRQIHRRLGKTEYSENFPLLGTAELPCVELALRLVSLFGARLSGAFYIRVGN